MLPGKHGARTVKPDIAIIRHRLSMIDGVSQTWFEWELEDWTWNTTLVVEVDFDTDPHAPGFQPAVIEAIATAAIEFSKEKTKMVVNHLKVVPMSRLRKRHGNRQGG